MKKHHNIIIIVLVYKNSDDLEEFLQSVLNNSIKCKIVVVNSFYDDDSNSRFKLIAKKHNCDFIITENNGYGAGNNRGIEYVRNYYDFDFLILSNPDVEIINFSLSSLKKYSDCIVGPLTINRKSKNKNPYWHLNISFIEWLQYLGAKKNNKILFFLGILVNKCERDIYQFVMKVFRKDKHKVFALQGTFLIFHKNSLLQLGTVFDEDMFLYAEEAHLAHLAKNKNVPMFYEPNISIFHKQGGSSDSVEKQVWQFQRQSIICYYEKWYNNGEK
jgi:GT2 family glycosyltransferase